MSKNFPRQITLDELIFLQEASHANHTAPQESDWEKKMTATSGRSCLKSFEKLRQPTSWAKMFAALLIGRTDWFSKRCVLTWKLRGTTFNRSYFQLQVSAHRTEGIESGLLLTPTTVERAEHPDDMRARAKKNGYKNGTKFNSLTSQVIYSGMLPTPNAMDWNTARSEEALNAAKEKHGSALQDSLRQRAKSGILPTPTTRDYKGARTTESLTQANRGETNSLPDAFAQSGKSSQLNPRFVAEMMGFPVNWTQLPFQSGETTQSKPMETP
jgi:hypothetical protein